MKKILLLIILFIMTFIMTGCFFKKSISSDKFIDITRNYKLKTYDISNHFSDKSIKKVILAQNSDAWQMEFYVFKDKESAHKMYLNTKDKYVSVNGKGKIYDDSSTKRYDNLTISTDNNYMHITRINNTMLYVISPIDYKVDAEKVLRALKYQ